MVACVAARNNLTVDSRDPLSIAAATRVDSKIEEAIVSAVLMTGLMSICEMPEKVLMLAVCLQMRQNPEDGHSLRSGCGSCGCRHEVLSA